MIKKVLLACGILLALITVLPACNPVTSTVTQTTIFTTTKTATSAITTSGSTTTSTTFPANTTDYFAGVAKIKQDSISAEIIWSATGNKAFLKSNDPRFTELLGFLNNSFVQSVTIKSVTTTENGTTTATQRTVPYVLGYVITFELKDGSTMRFNCSGESTWFETDQAIYEASFSQEFNAFLSTLTSTLTQLPQNQQPIEVVSVASPYKPGDTIIPAGPKIEITLKNISNEPVISLTALLSEEEHFNSPWTFNFNVTSVNPLLPGQSASVTNILIGGGFGSGTSYSLMINGTLRSRETFSFTWEPSTQNATSIATITQTTASTTTVTSTSTVLTEGDKAEIYAAVIRQLYTKDDSFGGNSNFPVIYLLWTTDDTVGEPYATDLGHLLIPESAQPAIIEKLKDLPATFTWIDNRDEVMDYQQLKVKGDAAIITLGNFHPQNDGAIQVPGSIYVAALAATGRTYVVELVDGTWKITGDTGAMWIS